MLRFFLLLLWPLLLHVHCQSTPPGCVGEVPSANVTCPTDRPGVVFTYPDPLHCSRYWECYNSCAENLVCQQDWLYDEVFNWCSPPQDVYCYNRPCDDRPCPPNPSPTPPPPDFDCPESNGFYSDPTNCIKYFQCSNDIPTRHTCQLGADNAQLCWSPEDEWCDYQDRVSCGERPICDANDENCFFATSAPPTYCDAIECTGGQYVPQGPCERCCCECPPGHDTASEICCQAGLFWNPATNLCDWPENNAGCGKKL